MTSEGQLAVKTLVNFLIKGWPPALSDTLPGLYQMSLWCGVTARAQSLRRCCTCLGWGWIHMTAIQSSSVSLTPRGKTTKEQSFFHPVCLLSAYLSRVAGQQKTLPGSHSQQYWHQTSSVWASCCRWRPGHLAWMSRRSGQVSAHWHGHCKHPHSHSGTGCHSPGRWSGMTRRPLYPQRPVQCTIYNHTKGMLDIRPKDSTGDWERCNAENKSLSINSSSMTSQNPGDIHFINVISSSISRLNYRLCHLIYLPLINPCKATSMSIK